jgi:hypothetical protein
LQDVYVQELMSAFAGAGEAVSVSGTVQTGRELLSILYFDLL